MANSLSGESVIERTVKILRAFGRDTPKLTMSELARSTGLSTSTTHRLATELLDAGLLERDPEGRLGVGIQMWELAARSNPAEDFRRRGLPVLEGIHAAVRQHVSLSIPRFESHSVLYLERLDQHGTASILAEVAGRLDMHTTSAGLTMMAHAPHPVQERFLSTDLERVTPSTDIDPISIRSHLALIRERGYSCLKGVLVESNVAYSVPVFGVRNAVVGAIAVVTPVAEDSPQLIIPVLVAAGHSLSRTMGAEKRPYGNRSWLDEGRS
ncbi:IclR family transcriptional regulator [Paeniglutamicibacter cryotolerans]|uniref:DNA-binding IclR family transcriptional regulator n=1 Tax=Paeniglutamicibacter cryotolerans TaxID=670079 RepID=A0A839QPF9_9MICC|nr:IclR family transcriptional regulator [Paeniglutamicibacter cryotolerans]MBB2993971.1 DNA-binding IclR family transcriptional regulator [Paeniglutamicibacter cryotolerans]